ncbi:hypothetical protein Ahy_B10g106247 [Arachis hypogaea]|uniref:Uncharacterized protein n=1 Tax=Arachis hypogaea TaxID=3818 RepID=A0A444XA62_ARAHY|nr:hypothetical protein Ahy_B10g106247 [Arachis hypogaea]
MVLELVGGAFLGAVFNVLLERIASPEVLSFLKGKKMNNRLLKKLKLILLSVHGVLDDAEGKQITNPAVKEWLDELKDAAYEADDLLDEIYTRSKYGAAEVCNFDFNSWSSFENEVEEKMEEIIEKLEFIAKQKDFLGLTGDIGVKIPQKTPTTSIVEGSNVYGRDDDKEYPSINFDAFQKASGLHTFLQLSLVDPPICLFNKVPKDLFMKLRRLRVLSLVGARGSLNELLHFIAKLRHLRYLDVSQTQIKKLPGSICTLYNLQTLKAARCPHLTELPRNMHCLVNLRYLDISFSRLERMPLHMSKLKSLQKLSNFFVSKESASSIGELGELSHLRGSLMIQNIKNVVDPKDAMKASLKDKRNLDKLTFDWGRSADTENSQHEKNILEKLQPNTNLEALEIVHYTGTQFPTWLGDPSFFHLVSLSLNHCKYCHILPSLGQLPYLKELHISKFKELVSIGPEFYGVSGCTGNQHFPSLEILTFYGMPAWEKWIHAGESEGCKVFPCLRELHLEECPQLSGDLPTFLPSLTNLTMRYCNQISTSLPRAPAMRSLHVDNCWKVEILEELMGCRESLESLEIYNSCHSLKSFPLDFFPYLKSLVIWGCENLESLTTSAPQTEGTLELLASLNSLCIWRCHNFVNFPHAGLPTPNLASLKVRYCSKLSSLPKQMHTLLPSLKELQVWSCPEIKSLPNGGLPINLKSFKIRDCDNLFARRLDWNMSCLASLEHFSVEGKCEDVESFPEEGLLPSTLTQLEIQGLSNLKTLDMKGLQNLTSLKKIQILDCCKLESLGEGGTLPLSAVDLDIWKCPLLKEQWQRENKPNISGNHGIWICDQYIEVDEQHDLWCSQNLYTAIQHKYFMICTT